MVLINELIGSFGKYQLWLCLIVFINKFGVAFHQMAIIFLAPPAKYQCPNNKTCCDNPIFDISQHTRTIVMEWNLICDRVWLKDLNQTVFQLGVLTGSLVFGIVSDRYGRRPTLILSVVIEVFSGVMSCFLPDYWSFTFVRTILGFSVGGVMVVGFVIVMEYVGNVNRNTVSAFYHVPFTLGYMLLALFGYFIRDYVYLQLSISLTNVILLFYICILPESPRWLLAVNKTFDAVVLIKRVAKVNKLPLEEIESKIESYQLEHIHLRDKRGTFLDLFRTPNLRKNIIVMSFTWFVCSYCFYGVTFYISHLTGDVYINVIASGVVCLITCIVAIPVMKFIKRKTSVFIGNILSSVCLVLIAVVPEGYGSVVFGCIGLFFTYMVFIVNYLYCSEMFPTVVRTAAIGICSMMARVGSMLAPFVADLRPFGQWCAPVAFGFFPLISAALCLLLPETKDCELMMTIEEGEDFGKISSTQAETSRPDALT